MAMLMQCLSIGDRECKGGKKSKSRGGVVVETGDQHQIAPHTTAHGMRISFPSHQQSPSSHPRWLSKTSPPRPPSSQFPSALQSRRPEHVALLLSSISFLQAQSVFCLKRTLTRTLLVSFFFSRSFFSSPSLSTVLHVCKCILVFLFSLSTFVRQVNSRHTLLAKFFGSSLIQRIFNSSTCLGVFYSTRKINIFGANQFKRIFSLLFFSKLTLFYLYLNKVQ